MTTHTAYVETEETTRINGERVVTKIEPRLVLSNDEDGYYKQYFHSHEDVEAFIAELRKQAVLAFGELK